MSELYKVESVAEAWLTGVRHLLNSPGHTDYNVILEISAPMKVNDGEAMVFKSVDAMLKTSGNQTLETVANTIFPHGLYRRHGTPAFYDIYKKEVYPAIRQLRENRWGTYAHRLMHREAPKGNIVNPVDVIIHRIKTETRGVQKMRSRFELNMVDPFIDLNLSDPGLPGDTYRMGGPCLSHLSFKMREDGQLALTAFYRSHYYVERLLGNLMGLSHLMSFVAKEANVALGPLTVISSYALLDTGKERGIAELRKLVNQFQL
ncbi:hypothetical protein [Solimonas terrae]|uniref:Thymidylate synthase n=1 Tax=Solimonas terrae TaxID=1396819 RepID=A0A6M2BTQ8_9GAMM|nr:hypothetical protein [Solimonas terrae]NGY05615.1 hypothetical protein [Solimonas terrae]